MKLLLAEDDQMLSKVLVTLLNKNNYSVDVAFNSHDALTHLKTTIYDGAILDIMMPKHDCITVLQKIREIDNTFPVLILTAKSDIVANVHELNNRANDFLAKPFASEEFLTRVLTMTKCNDKPANPSLKFGNIILNCNTLEIQSHTSSFPLTNKEFQLMELFMKHPMVILYKHQIADILWNHEGNDDTNSVPMYISFLIKKLMALDADIMITTIENNSYILERIKTED